MRGERTIHNPHPEDEHLVTYTMLKSMLPLGQARLIMAAVGVVWEDNAVFDEEFASFSPQRLKESASVADTGALTSPLRTTRPYHAEAWAHGDSQRIAPGDCSSTGNEGSQPV
jgi:hypothetical protein